MDFCVLIPARLASTRLPDKPLADIAGMPMVVRVAQRAGASSRCPRRGRRRPCIDRSSLPRHGVEAVLTRADHASGSDRLAEACELLGLSGQDVVVNVQGDEPLIEPALIDSVAALLEARPEASMSTAAHAIDERRGVHQPQCGEGRARRAGLGALLQPRADPWWRDGFAAGIKALPEPRAPAPRRHLRLSRGFPARVSAAGSGADRGGGGAGAAARALARPPHRGARHRNGARASASTRRRTWSGCAPCGASRAA